MLYLNDIFAIDGHRHRLLHLEVSSGIAWTINLDDHAEWPRPRVWADISHTEAWKPDAGIVISHSTASPAMIATRDNALKRLGALTKKVPAIFDECRRSQMVREQAVNVSCSRTSIYKDLGRYWRGGQTPAALLGNYSRCGTGQVLGTAGRGKKSKYGYTTYQQGPLDFEIYHRVIESHYLKSEIISIPATFRKLCGQSYTMEDGNGKKWIRPAGERPSFKQFEYFLRKHYPLEVRIRSRSGDKEFERNHRPKLSHVLVDCLGVGHFYEADATIADVYLVASDDVREIIGKPTMYLIIDRKSRLIVGWYVGLENPSWVCARQAIMSISQDKEALCKDYGVTYDSNDWPAHAIYPQEFLADRGELFSKESSKLSDNLGITVTNVPAKRPDWKPIVECGFKQMRVVLADVTPGFDPPENATKRQGKHYEKDACLTLKDFGAIVLNAIIAHNRSPMRNYPLNLAELAGKFPPSPIAIWNHNIVERAGALSRYSEEDVRMELLSQGEATVTENGILFNGCFYTCPEALDRGWFVQARRKNFELVATYDSRIVNKIYVQRPGSYEAPIKCELTDHSKMFRGMSFAEVKALQKLHGLVKHDSEQLLLQTKYEYHQAVEKITKPAMEGLKKHGKGVSRHARKVDTKPAREIELRAERQRLTGEEITNISPSAQVLSLPVNRKNKAASKMEKSLGEEHSMPGDASDEVETSNFSDEPRPTAELDEFQLMRQQMLEG